MEYNDFPPGTILFPGLRLINVEGMPNVHGPNAPLDNQLTITTWCGHRKQFICLVHGVRYSDRNLDEIKEDLPQWEFIAEIPKSQEIRPGDFTDN